MDSRGVLGTGADERWKMAASIRIPFQLSRWEKGKKRKKKKRKGKRNFDPRPSGVVNVKISRSPRRYCCSLIIWK